MIQKVYEETLLLRGLRVNSSDPNDTRTELKDAQSVGATIELDSDRTTDVDVMGLDVGSVSGEGPKSTRGHSLSL